MNIEELVGSILTQVKYIADWVREGAPTRNTTPPNVTVIKNEGTIENLFTSPTSQGDVALPMRAASANNVRPLFQMNEFDNYISNYDDREHVYDVLGRLLKGKKGKSAAKVIRAAIRCGMLLREPTYNAVALKFGDIGSRTNYYRYMEYVFTDEELQSTIEQLLG